MSFELNYLNLFLKKIRMILYTATFYIYFILFVIIYFIIRFLFKKQRLISILI